MNGKVIILERDKIRAERISSAITKAGATVAVTCQQSDFITECESFFPDVIVIDIESKGNPIFDIDILKSINPECSANAKIIVISSDKISRFMERLHKLGIFYVVDKDSSLFIEQLMMHIDNALHIKQHETENLSLQIENITLKKHLISSYPFIGESKAILEAKSQIQRLAMADEDMFVIGETGTGKEIAVNYYYQNSRRFGRPFHTVNCSALTETLIESELFGHMKGSFTNADKSKLGFFEKCTNGILFLDELTNLSLASQSKILRAIENKEIQVVGGDLKRVDTRLLFASNATQERLSRSEVFRKDLYYRIEGNIVELLPLRERGNDIILLLSYYFSNSTFSGEYDYTRLLEIKDILLSYSWPGNVRELVNFSKFIILNERELSNRVIVKHLESKLLKHGNMNEPGLHRYLRESSFRGGMQSFERDYLTFHLRKNNWRISQTARSIGIERTTLYKKMKTYKITSANQKP
jgi:DNA-binding NtrC family response regulator